jgi:PAS domain S-box-containing protein
VTFCGNEPDYAKPPSPGKLIATMKKTWQHLARGVSDLGIGEKLYSIVALLVFLTTLLLVMSVQAVRLQTAFRQELAAASTAAINIERVNGLIYAIVMESRGIYMSADAAKAKPFGDELLNRNRELAEVVTKWEKTIHFDDAAQFLAFKGRITQFIEFRKELVRRSVQVSTAAARELGDNDANRALRSQLNVDLEAFARIHANRAQQVAELGDRGRYASWYLFALGLGALALAALNVMVMKGRVIGPLSQITRATALIAAGKTELAIPFVARKDEIGHLARAVQNFRDTACRNLELEQLEIGTALQRDAAMGERDKLNDKYLETKWQLSAALNNMAQGLVMIDSKTKILTTNVRFRAMYQLPPHIIGPETTLRDILVYRAGKGLFAGNVDDFMIAILDRIAKGKPSVREMSLDDGRVVRVSEQPMAGGGWVATHEDFTEARRAERILERTERFLATIIENVTQAIVAKDARDLRYIFVNKAAEELFGLPRAQIIGRSASDLFPADTAEMIEQQDRLLLSGEPDFEVSVRTVSTPNNGRRVVSARRLRIAGDSGQSQVFLSMIEDLTDRPRLADAAA